VTQKTSSALRKFILLGTACIAPLGFAEAANAQVTREIINPSFEDGPTPGTFVIASDTQHPGWLSTNGEMETWRAGFLQRSAQDGTFLVELNPSAPVGLYQEVCLFNGENLSWDFYHAARGNPTNAVPTQTVVYEVVDSNDNFIQGLTTNTLVPMGPTGTNNTNNLWDNVTGNVIYNGPTGVQRLQFRSTNNGSNGNFLDNINVDLVPTITLTPTSSSDLETGSGPYPEIVIKGELLSDTTVSFSILPSSTATLGADYTIASNTVIIPAGSYDGVSAASMFGLGITVLTDGLYDPNETIEIQIDSVIADDPIRTPALASAPNVCDNATLPTAIHTILDVDSPDSSLTMTKVASDPGPYTEGDVITYTYTITNDGNVNVNDVTVTDTHNGSDPAPIPGNETLLTDNIIIGDSTDAAADGSWDVLAPGDVVTFTGTYTVTAADADNL